MFRLAEDHAVINRLGFNNAGFDALAGRLTARRRRGIVGVNIGANRASSDRAGDYATGVKRFTLPDEFNFIAILERVGAKTEFKSAAWEALNSLAESFQNRRQLPRAAEVWRQALALHYYDQGAQAALDQIVKNWCRFDASLVQTPGQGATVGFVFRNGTKAKSGWQP